MKKILICGATHGTNFGDMLFAHLFKDSIELNNENVEIFFTRTSIHAQKTLNLKKLNFKDFNSIDGMVYISGGYFGQSHKETLKQSIIRFKNYFFYGLVAIALKKPIAISGVGAGPLDRVFLRKTAVYLFNKPKSISVRDIESKNFMKEYGVKNEMIVTSDSAQVVENKVVSSQEIFSEEESRKLLNKHLVLVHLPGGSSQKHFKDKIIPAIKEALFPKSKVGFILTYDQVNDDNFINDIYDDFPKNRTIIHKYTDVQRYLKVIQKSDTIITTKLHTGIMGATFEKAVISFPHHPGKTKRYYSQIGYFGNVKSLFDVKKNEASQLINENFENKLFIPKEVVDQSKRNFKLVNEFIKEINEK